ncbi:hypothetical protein PSPO_b0693 [Pseudoalteromonas spongiae UST010723-006]|nr:hypothetical protein PSPO_b0693 [Pseudoalteromonas spongiae UST010723-006]
MKQGFMCYLIVKFSVAAIKILLFSMPLGWPFQKINVVSNKLVVLFINRFY